MLLLLLLLPLRLPAKLAPRMVTRENKNGPCQEGAFVNDHSCLSLSPELCAPCLRVVVTEMHLPRF